MLTTYYAPADRPTYEREPDAEFEETQRLPAVHRGQPAWVPQVEYHPDPPHKGIILPSRRG